MIEKISDLFEKIFAGKIVHKVEKIVVVSAVSGFLIHLLLIFLHNSGYLQHPVFEELSYNYISAIYTPFSFLLIYEVYLFLIYLQKSFTKSIGKQYEIISLIVLRRIFKDISHFDLEHLTENIKQNSELLLDMVGVLLLFLLIGIFYHLKKRQPIAESGVNLKKFIALKRLISMMLLPVLIGLAIYSFGQWIWEASHYDVDGNHRMTDINHIFYDTFFSILIYVDVFILIISFLYTRYYSQLVRNSGFVISTVLIRLSFTASHTTNIFLILASVLFGVLILLLYNFFITADERQGSVESDEELSE
jgi:hypothetical protein